MKIRTSTKLAIGCLALLSSTASFAQTRFLRLTNSSMNDANFSIPTYGIRPSLSWGGYAVMYTMDNLKNNVWTQSVQMDKIALGNPPRVVKHIEFPTGAPAGSNTYVATSPSMSTTGSIVAIAQVSPRNADSKNTDYLEYRDRLRIFAVSKDNSPQLIFEKAGEELDSVNSVRVSALGRFVAYELVSYNYGHGVETSIYVYNVKTKSEKKIWSKTSYSTEVGIKGISDDGKRILLGSSGESDTAGDNLSVLNVDTKKISKLTSVKDPMAGPTSSSWDAAGLMTAFATSAPMVTSDTNRALDVYLTSTATPDSFIRISSLGLGKQPNFSSGQPQISSNGQYVAFVSRADNLRKNDVNYAKDLFVYSIQDGAIIATVSGDDDIELPAISSTGDIVAFVSGATNIVTDDENKARDVFVAWLPRKKA